MTYRSLSCTQSDQGLNSVRAGRSWISHVSLEFPHPTNRLPHVQLQLPCGLTYVHAPIMIATIYDVLENLKSFKIMDNC